MATIFTKIINGDIPSYKIYENEYVLAFLDINPDSNGHTLIIPKKYVKDIEDIDNELLIHIFDAAREIKKIMEEKLKIDGLTFVQNNGEIQDVKHYHLHLKPFYKEKQPEMSLEEVYNILKN